jgi:hypothetical protein
VVRLKRGRSSGRLREAETLLRQVLRDHWLLDGRDARRNRYTRNMLAVVLAARWDLAGGIEQMREALASDKRLCEEATVDTGTMTSQLGGTPYAPWIACRRPTRTCRKWKSWRGITRARRTKPAPT